LGVDHPVGLPVRLFHQSARNCVLAKTHISTGNSCHKCCRRPSRRRCFKAQTTLTKATEGKAFWGGAQVYRLVLADSGTLLLCCVDPTGAVEELRAQLGERFPGAPSRQTATLHITLLRILTPRVLTPQERTSIQVRAPPSRQTLAVFAARAWSLPGLA
jgi:hypothetical protein